MRASRFYFQHALRCAVSPRVPWRAQSMPARTRSPVGMPSSLLPLPKPLITRPLSSASTDMAGRISAPRCIFLMVARCPNARALTPRQSHREWFERHFAAPPPAPAPAARPPRKLPPASGAKRLLSIKLICDLQPELRAAIAKFKISSDFAERAPGRSRPDSESSTPSSSAGPSSARGLPRALSATPTHAELWTELYAPTIEARNHTCNLPADRAQSECAVHARKVQDVRTWLAAALEGIGGEQRVLLMTGPTGCGKTAVLRMLARELRAEVAEWINPVQLQQHTFDPLFSESIMRTFKARASRAASAPVIAPQDFLLRAERYPTLAFAAAAPSRKLIVVEVRHGTRRQ